MEITDELIAILYDKYDVYFNNNLQAWMRNKGKWNKRDYDLGVITKLITGENVTIKGMSYVKYTEDKIDGKICVCGCPFCETLFPMYHTKTNICFMVGSQCIKKAGHEDFVKNFKCGKKNGFCKECKFPLRLNGDLKNYDKYRRDYTCNHCYDVEQRIIRQKEQKVLNEIRMREQEEQKVLNEIRIKERLDRLQTIFLTIKFADKDKYKKYGTRWNPDEKSWYWEGDINEFPIELIPLKR